MRNEHVHCISNNKVITDKILSTFHFFVGHWDGFQPFGSKKRSTGILYFDDAFLITFPKAVKTMFFLKLNNAHINVYQNKSKGGILCNVNSPHMLATSWPTFMNSVN